MKIRSIIIDDERPSREALANYINDYCPEVEIVAQCNAAMTAYQSIHKLKPDLIFLDIEMPNGNGFDLLKMFKSIDFKVIFVTAYSEYAIQAFRFSAADYLLKPIKVDEITEAIRKVKQDIELKRGDDNIKRLLERFSQSDQASNQIVIPDQNGFKIVNANNLIYCEADGYCTHFFLTGNEKITSSRNLKHYEELLAAQDFLRVHNSYLVNLIHVQGYSHEGEIRLSEKHICSLGNGYKKEFLDRFKKLK
jgi:two-component system, LytTR family, response regulator